MFLLTKTGPVYYGPPYYDILLSFIGQSGIVFLRCARSSPYTYYYCKKHPILHVTPSTFVSWFCVHRTCISLGFTTAKNIPYYM